MRNVLLEKIVKVSGFGKKATGEWFSGQSKYLEKALRKRWNTSSIMSIFKELSQDNKAPDGTLKPLGPLSFVAAFTLHVQYYFAFHKVRLEGPIQELKGQPATLLNILEEFKAWWPKVMVGTPSAAKVNAFYKRLQSRLSPDLEAELKAFYPTPQFPTQMSDGAGAIESKSLTPPRHEVVAPLSPELAALQEKLNDLYAKEEQHWQGVEQSLGRQLTLGERERLKDRFSSYQQQGIPAAAYVDAAGATFGR